MEHVITEQLKSLEYAISGLETIKQLISDSPIDDTDKELFTEILSHAYKKGVELNKSIEAHIKRKNKPIKFKKTK